MTPGTETVPYLVVFIKPAKSSSNFARRSSQPCSKVVLYLTLVESPAVESEHNSFRRTFEVFLKV